MRSHLVLGAVGALLVSAAALSAAFTNPSQIWYTAVSGTKRLLSAKLSDTVSVKDFGAVGDGVTDDRAAVVAAIAALPSEGGAVVFPDGDYKITSSLTISKSGTELRLPVGTVNIGANQIIVPAGVHGVRLIGAAGDNIASPATAIGTRIVYTGTGTAVVVGDTGGASDTYRFRMDNLTLDCTGAGSTAICLQLNRTIGFALSHVHIGIDGTIGTALKGVDLEGGANYTGGRVDDLWVSGGAAAASAVYFGGSANAITITGGHITMGGSTAGTAYNMACANGLNCTGNLILGGDVENVNTVIAFDYAQNNSMIGTRSEAATNAATATAHAFYNRTSTSGTDAMTVTDSGTGNSFSDPKWTQFSRLRWLLNGALADSTADLEVDSGLSTVQLARLLLIDKSGTGLGWRVQKDTSNNFTILNHSTSAVRLQFGSANTFINGESGTVFFNTSKLGINSGGNVSTYSNVATAGVGIVPIYGKVALTAQTADLAATSVYASVPIGEYRVCATARTTTSGTGTTATLNIIWQDEGGSKTDVVGTWALNSVAVTGQINKCEYIHAVSTSNIQVSVSGGTYGTSAYAISATAERLN